MLVLKVGEYRYCKQFTLATGIFSLTESTNDKSISATTIPVAKRSETQKQTNSLNLQGRVSKHHQKIFYGIKFKQNYPLS
jgi:hypothetical protein